MIDVDIITGLVAEARWRPSPHFDARPDNQRPTLLVLHCISLPEGEYGTPYIDDLFLGQLDIRAHESFATLDGVRVSAHLLIRRDGGLVQYVSLNERAWHAGESEFRGRTDVNDFSVGVELEGSVESTFTTAQYWQLARLHRGLLVTYREMRHQPVGHSDIAPMRKRDPGPGFDWMRWRAMAGVTNV